MISPALLDFLEQAIEPIPKIQLVSLKGHKNGKVIRTIKTLRTRKVIILVCHSVVGWLG